MHIELLTIGDELLDGRVDDTNSSWLGDQLYAIGLDIHRRTTIADDANSIRTAIQEISTRAAVCICTGGLGPTGDDLTISSLAAAAGDELVWSEAVWRQIQKRYGDRPIPDSNRQQAFVPSQAEILPSEVGTAAGLKMQIGSCRFFVFPGVPFEMAWHTQTYLLPELKAQHYTIWHQDTVRVVGIGESQIAALVDSLNLPQIVDIGYRTCPPENHVKLRSRDKHHLQKASIQVRQILGPSGLASKYSGLPEATLDACRRAGISLGTAESCTGGLIGAALTGIPGSSDVFKGGIVSYSNDIKRSALGVSQSTLDGDGAVSEACATEMALGAREALKCDLAVAVTGIAGPGGGRAEKPVGTVCLAWSSHRWSHVETKRFRGNRERVRTFTVARALDVIRRHVNG